MADFVSGVVTVITTLFAGLLKCLQSIGELVFVVSTEGGAITGLTPFGWLAVTLVGIPLATWLLNKAIGIFKLVFKK